MKKKLGPEEKIDLLIFDMDGVLVDVSQSYRKTIQQTIHIYLKDCLGVRANFADSFVIWSADGVRKYKRIPVARKINYFAPPYQDNKTSDVLTADILDISEGGMCMRTDCRLDPGHTLKLYDAKIQCEGVVRWSARSEAAEAHHVGIQFVSTLNNLHHILQ